MISDIIAGVFNFTAKGAVFCASEVAKMEWEVLKFATRRVANSYGGDAMPYSRRKTGSYGDWRTPLKSLS